MKAKRIKTRSVSDYGANRMSDVKKEMREIKQRIECARTRFEFQSEPELVESAVYEIKSLDARYRYLIKTAKELNRKENPTD